MQSHQRLACPKAGSAIPADLCIAVPLEQGQESQLGWLLNPPALLACHIPVPVEAIGDSMASEDQVDQVLTAVAMCGYEAGLRLIHVQPGLPAHTCQACVCASAVRAPGEGERG